MMRILIAPNAFKNSLDAEKVAEAISKGLRQSKLSCELTCLPVADGGDGTAYLLGKKFGAKKIEGLVNDPIGRKIKACFGWVEQSNTAIIEMADASGLKLLQPNAYSALGANSFGTGELIKLALDKGANKIILGIGGSASTDGGTGIMQALGVLFFDEKGNELKTIPSSLINLHRIDLTKMDKRLQHTHIIVLCDVKNKLLGKTGTATIFAPQKGATEKDIVQLELILSKISNIVFVQTGKDMSAIERGAAAGGVAAGLSTILNADLVDGIEYFLDTSDFDKLLQKTDLVITGEGSIDRQTLDGKAAFGVAKRAKSKKIPVVAFTGKVPLVYDDQLQEYFDILLPINHQPMDIATAIKYTYENIVRSSTQLGNLLNI